MKKKNKLGKYEKGIIIAGIVVLIIFLILLAADGIKNMGKNNNPIALLEQEVIVPPNVPVLSAGMIPVKYNGDNLIICKNDSSWYNYEEGTPAYMMLNDGVYQSELVVDMTNKKLASDSIGQTVAPDELGTIYMWIPRFEINQDNQIKYVRDVNYESEGYEIPEIFIHKQEPDTSPDFLLTGIWVEKTPLANASAVTNKITNMQGENNIYGFIANTVGVAMTEEDKTIIGRAMLAPTEEENQDGTVGAQAMHNEAVTRDARTATIICARMDAPTNQNRTILKIINDKYQDPIKAKVEYNKTTGLIETTITYSKYGINKIMLEDTNELQITNTNGIITATVKGTPGKNKITIIDSKGNKKRIKVAVPYKYGNKVFGYECATEGVEWRLFHADDQNIYLIADDYIPYEDLPTSTAGTALNKGSTNYNAYFTNILNDYTGSTWIKENTDEKAQKWLNTYLTAYPESTNPNIKAVAYMMDTQKWGEKFKGEKADYAVGGPTIELFCASYKETHLSRYIECGNINEYGYDIKWSDESWPINNYVTGLVKDDFDSIYIKSDITKTYGMWIASSNANDIDRMMCAYSSGLVNHPGVNSDIGFRPVVCLKSDVKLVDNGDNTYSIKEPITAKAEYNANTNQINIRVAYSEHGVSRIMLNDTTELVITNTNGIVIANISGISLEDGTYTITITDNDGNTKELKVQVKISLSIYYGKKVTNYTCEASGVDTWRVFHVDNQNIYLIADDYVSYANLPTSTKGNALNKGRNNYNASLSNIEKDYAGSSWIRLNSKAKNWLSWINSYPSSTGEGIRAVAYMMDTESWSSFVGEKAEYAIGGPTIELFCASYNVTHPNRYIACNSINAHGYQIKWSDGSYGSNISGLTTDFNNIYIKGTNTRANGTLIASPGSSRYNVLGIKYSGDLCNTSDSTNTYGFRPVVCLKSGVKLIDNGNGTCSIQ